MIKRMQQCQASFLSIKRKQALIQINGAQKGLHTRDSNPRPLGRDENDLIFILIFSECCLKGFAALALSMRRHDW